MKRLSLMVLFLFVLPQVVFSDPVSNLSVQQRFPWNGLVDITCDIGIEGSGDNYKLSVTATQGEDGPVLPVTTVYQAGKTVADGLEVESGPCHLIWDAGADAPEVDCDDVRITMTATEAPALYCVIDLSAGSSASSYPVSYLYAEPSGSVNKDEYKTTKLVLKRIPAGSFIMGSDQTNESHRVTLTQDFYMGVFEVTQKQWSLVMGSDPCSSTSYGKGNTYPVHYVSYNMIRGSSNGAQWPSSSAVDSSSFLGKLQAKTGLAFDLPTEAQWEYACRAGTTTTYYWGNSMNGNYAWYTSNSSGKTHPVGGKTPNAWGLYDMSGNVWEWCLDWYGTLSYGTDPKGSSSGSSRVSRGGSWSSDGSGCTSSYRYRYDPSYTSRSSGFRLSRTLP